MSALSAARNVSRMNERPIPEGWNIGVKTNVKLYPGAIALLELSSGYLVQGQAGTGYVALGVCQETTVVDMTGLTSGSKLARILSGTFPMVSAGGADAITSANVGQDCYVVDDQTVALTDANGTRCLAGSIAQVDSAGVWVTFAGWMRRRLDDKPRMVISIALDLATLANAQVYAVTPPFGGRLLKTSFTVRKPATTASKAATLTPQINGVALSSGGVLSLTSANCTPAGAEVAGSAIASTVSDNVFAAGQPLQLAVSGVTTFAEGDGVAYLHIG